MRRWQSAARKIDMAHDESKSNLTPEAIAALQPGTNVLAAHCHQTKGGQHIDIGLVDVEEGR